MLILAQILLDLLILVLLVWLIKTSLKKAGTGGSKTDSFPIPETLVEEMREIAADLGQNLEQKRNLSHDILQRLDEGLGQAEAYLKKIEKINESYRHQLRARGSEENDRAQIRSSVQAMISKGFSREEIARRLGISLGEIDLLIKLQPRTRT